MLSFLALRCHGLISVTWTTALLLGPLRSTLIVLVGRGWADLLANWEYILVYAFDETYVVSNKNIYSDGTKAVHTHGHKKISTPNKTFSMYLYCSQTIRNNLKSYSHISYLPKQLLHSATLSDFLEHFLGFYQSFFQIQNETLLITHSLFSSKSQPQFKSTVRGTTMLISISVPPVPSHFSLHAAIHSATLTFPKI